MAFPKIKLCWNGSKVAADWHLGLFGTYARGGGTSRLRGIVISLRGVLAWLAALAVVAYFTGAAALWFWLDRRPFNHVTYADLVLPTRWQGVQALRGQALIDEGLADIEARKWSEGLQKLRVGISRNPADTKGRLVLAEIFVAMKARRQAVEIYDGGLAERYPGRDYIEAMIKSATQSGDQAWLLRTCDRALELVSGDPALAGERAWLTRQKISALLSAGRAAEALALAEAEGESGSPAISELRVLALLKEGQPAKAVAFLDEWAARAADREDPQILRLQVRAFREAGDLAAMERSLEILRAKTPMDPRPYVYAIVQRRLAGLQSEADEGVDRFLLRFGSSQQALLLLAQPLAEIEELALLKRLEAHARQQGFAPAPFQRFQVQVLLAEGKWHEASAVLAGIEPAAGQDQTTAAWSEIMGAQIRAALDPAEGVQSTLVNLVRGRQFTLSFYKDLITAMRTAGRPATAREIVTFAQGMYPHNEDIESWRLELDRELEIRREAASAAVAAATAAARPAVSETASSQVPPASRAALVESDVFARIAGLVEADDLQGALQQVREVRRRRPEWLEKRNADLLAEEIRVNGRMGDLLATRAAARFYLNGDRARSARVVEIARDLHERSREEEAVMLLNELLARSPNYTPAKQLLGEWVPAPPEAQPPRLTPAGT